MKTLLQQIVMTTAVSVLLMSPVRATDYWVDGLDGLDGNDGLTISTAKKTIQEAVKLANTSGDIVNILPGPYDAGFDLDPSDPAGEKGASGITIRGVGEVVIQDPVSSRVDSVSGPLTRIENITFRGPTVSCGNLRIVSSSDMLLERCRFLDGFMGLEIRSLLGNITVRECLFIKNVSGISEGGVNIGIRVERCTFARNEVGYLDLGTPSVVLLLNCAFFDNQGPSSTTPSYSYCNFSAGGDTSPQETCPDLTNICDAPPLFVDPDNDVYYVQALSPLLAGGQDGGPIGAFGQGFHTSKDVTKDEGGSVPAQGPSPWAAWRWVDGGGNLLPLTDAGSPVELNDLNEVILKMNITMAAIYSPVFDTGSPFTVIRSVDFAAFEDTTAMPDSREIVDAVQSTPRREINIRTSLTTFVQDPLTGPPFEEVDKRVKLRKRAQYVQMELVLRIDGD